MSILHTAEFVGFMKKYVDKNNKLLVDAVNREFIQFASRSNQIHKMIANNATSDELFIYVIKNRLADISGSKDFLSDIQIEEFLDEIQLNTKSVFKNLKLYLRRMISKHNAKISAI